MKILVIAPAYPQAEYPYAGIFNQRSAEVLFEICEHVEVLVPRPYLPWFLISFSRWKIFANAAAYEERNGIVVHRPQVLRIPKIGAAFWSDTGAFLFCRNIAYNLHKKHNFDAIISYDLLSAGGLAWRTGKYLGIPSCGWATGGDVRVNPSSSLGRVVKKAIRNLDIVFYQSRELLQKAADLTETSINDMSLNKHCVLPRGITFHSNGSKDNKRKTIRSVWGMRDDEIIVLTLGRVLRQKGIFELLNAAFQVISSDKKIYFKSVGSMPDIDDTEIILNKLNENSFLKSRFSIIPACNPDEVWGMLYAADIFVFTSYHEGMSNSLLEAMSTGLPSIAFAIPSVEELDAGTNSLIKVPPFSSSQFAHAITKLASSLELRKSIGERGRKHVLNNYQMRVNMKKALEMMNSSLNRIGS